MRVIPIDRAIRTPDRVHLGPKRGPPRPMHYVRDYGMQPTTQPLWCDGDNKLATPHTASKLRTMGRLHHVRRPKVVVTPEPSLFGASKVLNGIPNLEMYQRQCRLQPDGAMPHHPGRVLPGLVQTTQALFGAANCKAGTTQVLRTLADTVPSDAPRYLTHDATAMSSSLSSYYRRTNLGAVAPDTSKDWITSYEIDYQPKTCRGSPDPAAAPKTYVHCLPRNNLPTPRRTASVPLPPLPKGFQTHPAPHPATIKSTKFGQQVMYNTDYSRDKVRKCVF